MKQLTFLLLFATGVFSCKTKHKEIPTQSISEKDKLDSLPVGRRIVTGFDKNGKSVIKRTALFPNQLIGMTQKLEKAMMLGC